MLNFFRKCVTTLVGKDDKDIRVQQISYNGVPKDAEIWAPYGMSYNLPPGCVCLYAPLSGDPGDLVVLPDRSQDRIKSLKEGEVAWFNPLTKTRTIYDKDGNIVTVTEGDVGNVIFTIKGKVSIVVNGDVDLKAANVNIDATTTNLGVGGAAIARVGDPVQVTIVGGSSAGTADGTITSGGDNTSI